MSGLVQNNNRAEVRQDTRRGCEGNILLHWRFLITTVVQKNMSFVGSCFRLKFLRIMRRSNARFDSLRGHWSIENRLHWQLDVTFQEDQSRIRKGHADANFSLLRRTALSMLKNNHTAKVGIKNKRLTAAWDGDYLLEVLFGT